MKTNLSCDVIMDLLPLYHDGVCGDSSKKLVEEHLKECEDCKQILAKMTDDATLSGLKQERDDVISHHTKAVKRKSLVVGISIASVMAIPVLVSMIINFATGRVLDWFFIVLTSLITLASVTVVPLISEKNRGILTLGSFTASLTLLLATCAIYTNGNWFFVAIIPIYFGLSILFAPYALSQLPLKEPLSRQKGLLSMTINTVLLYAVIIASGLYGQGNTWLVYWSPAFLITFVCSLLPWGLFFIIRYVKANAFTKAGLCTIFGSLFLAIMNSLIYWIIEGILRSRLLDANLMVWNNSTNLNGNIELIVLLTGCIIGGFFLIAGLLRKKREF